MREDHLSDSDIQQYALDSSVCGAAAIEHIANCTECRLKAESYQLLFAGINQQTEPVFDFDLEKAVLARLPKSKPKSLPENFYIYLSVLAGISLLGIALYYYGSYVGDLFSGIEPLSIYLLVTTVIVILIVLILDMYKSYQKKMRALNLY